MQQGNRYKVLLFRSRHDLIYDLVDEKAEMSFRSSVVLRFQVQRVMSFCLNCS